MSKDSKARHRAGVCQVKCVSFIKFSYRQFSKAAGFTWQN